MAPRDPDGTSRKFVIPRAEADARRLTERVRAGESIRLSELRDCGRFEAALREDEKPQHVLVQVNYFFEQEGRLLTRIRGASESGRRRLTAGPSFLFSRSLDLAQGIDLSDVIASTVSVGPRALLPLAEQVGLGLRRVRTESGAFVEYLFLNWRVTALEAGGAFRGLVRQPVDSLAGRETPAALYESLRNAHFDRELLARLFGLGAVNPYPIDCYFGAESRVLDDTGAPLRAAVRPVDPRVKVFISHAGADRERAASFRAQLLAANPELDVFLDDAGLKPGDPLWPVLLWHLRSSDHVLVLATPSALRSEGVKREIDEARRARGSGPRPALVPVILEGNATEVVSGLLGAEGFAHGADLRDASRAPGELAELLGRLF